MTGSGRDAYPISRRSFLRGVTAAAGLTIGGAALSACSTPVVSGLSTARSAKGSLDYWNLFGGGPARPYATARAARGRRHLPAGEPFPQRATRPQSRARTA